MNTGLIIFLFFLQWWRDKWLLLVGFFTFNHWWWWGCRIHLKNTWNDFMDLYWTLKKQTYFLKRIKSKFLLPINPTKNISSIILVLNSVKDDNLSKRRPNRNSSQFVETIRSFNSLYDKIRYASIWLYDRIHSTNNYFQ